MKKTKALPDMRGTDQPEHGVYLAKGGAPYRMIYCPAELYDIVLVAKLHEEAEEIREALDDINEYADLFIVLTSLAEHNGHTAVALHEAIAHRLKTKGAFTLGKVLVKS